MRKLSYATLLMLFLSFGASPLYADVPVSLKGDHKHSQQFTGKITLYRVQIQGMEIGPADDRLDAEILVVLDSAPDKVFGLRYHEDRNPASSAMVDTLREAFLHGTPVTLDSPLAPGKKHLKINWVQLESK